METKSNSQPASQADLRRVLLAIYNDIREELRSRRQGEYLYTAAAVTAYGAIAWGIAVLLSNNKFPSSPPYNSSRIMASVFCLVICITVIIKIKQEHKNYKGIFNQMISIVKKLNRLFQVEDYLPSEKSKPGPGAYFSILIVFLVGVCAIIFCLASHG